MRLALRLALRELRGGLGGFRIFLICLALGVAAIAAVGSVRQGLQDGLRREAAVILGGDAEMTFTYRFAFRYKIFCAFRNDVFAFLNRHQLDALFSVERFCFCIFLFVATHFAHVA